MKKTQTWTSDELRESRKVKLLGRPTFNFCPRELHIQGTVSGSTRGLDGQLKLLCILYSLQTVLKLIIPSISFRQGLRS